MTFIINDQQVSAEKFKDELFLQACKNFDIREDFHKWARKIWGKVLLMGKDYGYQIDMLADKDNDHYYDALDNYCKMWTNVQFYELTNSNKNKLTLKLDDTMFITMKEDL